MSFLKKIFGKSSDQSDKDILILNCPRCRRLFKVGIDAYIMTIEEAYKMMGFAWGDLEAIPKEDVIVSHYDQKQYGEPTSEIMQETRKMVKKIKKALAKGQHRVWYCERCGKSKGVYAYPTI